MLKLSNPFFSLKKVFCTTEIYKKYFLIIMFIISFVPLMYSLTYWVVSSFWLFFAVAICTKNELEDVKGVNNEGIV